MMNSGLVHHPLNPVAEAALVDRGLNPEIIANSLVYSARRAPRGEDGQPISDPIPDINGNIICYPFLGPDRELLTTKFAARTTRGKTYWQTKETQKHFYGLEIFGNPEVRSGGVSVVVVEGENDRIAVLSAGYPYVLSVPQGGSPAFDEKTGKPIPMKPEAEIDPENDPGFSYVFNDWELLQSVNDFVLFTDFDEVGERLRLELCRRLGKIRCRYTTRPSAEPLVTDQVEIDGQVQSFQRPVKDANEILFHLGSEAVLECINQARPYPVSGLYKLSDFTPVYRELYTTGFECLDPYVQLYEGQYIVCSGLPGSGKSRIWNTIAMQTAKIYDWVWCIVTLEEEVHPDLIRKLRADYLQRDNREWTEELIEKADAFIDKHIVFITRDPTGLDDEPVTAEWLCDRIEDAVVRYDVRGVILDPLNQMDHKRRQGEMRDEYMLRIIAQFKALTKRRRLCWITIVHPDKAGGRESARAGEAMTGYDISDGAAHVNTAEILMIVFRKSLADVMTDIYVRKVKFDNTGKVGAQTVEYDTMMGTFLPWIKPIG